jgi:hypothetical protein
MAINLENLTGLPHDFVMRLKMHDEIFTKVKFLEQFENDDNINQLIIDINNFCLENKIIGYHYTNAIESYILEIGLVIRTGEEIRQDFIKRHFPLFTKEEQNQILIHWNKRFDEEDAEVRDNLLFFNFTIGALKDGGAELLLSYYGGEQVYFPLFDLPHIGEKLKNIGTPMILKCTLNPNDIYTFIEYPWGKITVSSYHRIINPDAYTVDQDGYQKVGVNPENIEIIKYDVR